MRMMVQCVPVPNQYSESIAWRNVDMWGRSVVTEAARVAIFNGGLFELSVLFLDNENNQIAQKTALTMPGFAMIT